MTRSLDDFFEHLRHANPFRGNRVITAFGDYDDVASIHGAEFQELVGLVQSAASRPEGVGVVLWGEPGIGKSHLLDRLSRWAGRECQQAIVVYLANLQARPESLSRTLLRTVISLLTEGRHDRFRGTTLYRLIGSAITHSVHWWQGSKFTGRVAWAEAETAFHRRFEAVGRENPGRLALMGPIFPALFRFFAAVYHAEHQRLAGPDAVVADQIMRWLSADELDAAEAQSLGIPTGHAHDGVVAIGDDQQVKAVLVTLAQLAAWWGRPLVLCFDQVDTLEPAQVRALSTFLHGVLDAACNLVVLTAGVQETLLSWERDKLVRQSTWDRLAHHRLELQRIHPREARQLVESRLQRFQDDFLEVPQIQERVRNDPLFPLGQTWQAKTLAGPDLRPRDVVNWARDAWRNEQVKLNRLGGETWLKQWGTPNEASSLVAPKPPELSEADVQRLIDDRVAAKIDELAERRRLEPKLLPPDADNLSGLVQMLLRQIFRGDPSVTIEPGPPTFSFRLDRDRGTELDSTGVLCLVTGHRNSMTAALRRVLHDPQPTNRFVLISDQRRPLSLASRGREYFETLQTGYGPRFQHFSLSFPQYAELDAFQTVSLARAQDLEIELPGGGVRCITEREVLESPSRARRMAEHPLLRLLLATEEANPEKTWSADRAARIAPEWRKPAPVG